MMVVMVSDEHLLTAAREQTTRMLTRLQQLVTTESPSTDPAALRNCADLITRQWKEATGRDLTHVYSKADDRPHLLSASPSPRVLVLGHYDTMWPAGTVASWPFGTNQSLATGPGILDMKAGIVLAMTAIGLLGQDAGRATVLLTADEQIGSASSAALIAEQAVQAGAVLCCEPATPDGEVKIARRGVARYRLTAHGQEGVNAAIEIALQVPRVVALASAQQDTTVIPTATSAVPEAGHLDIDVCGWSSVEMQRVGRRIRRLEPQVAGASLTISERAGRPPFESAMSASLAGALRVAARRAGLAVPTGARWGTASDANLAVAAGVPTLDGLGAIGARQRTRDEHIVIPALADRAALLAALIRQLSTR